MLEKILLPKDSSFKKINKTITPNFYELFNTFYSFEVTKNSKNQFNRIVRINSKFKLFNNTNNSLSFSYNYLTKKYTYRCIYCQKYFNTSNNVCAHIINIVDKYNDFFTLEELENKFSNLEEQEKIKEQNERKKYNQNLINDFITNDSNNIIRLSSLVHIYPTLSKHVNEYSIDMYYLSLKVGIDKTYIVKNIQNFIDLIIDSKSYRYGKDLEFNHNINNFDNKSKKIINMISNNNQTSNKFLELNFSNIDTLFDTYKDDFIFFDFIEKFIYVSLEPLEVSIEMVDKKLILKDLINPIYIRGLENDYIINNERVYTINCTPEVKKLIYFIVKNKDFSFEYVEDDFFKNIYSKYADDIIPTDDFKKRFDLKTLKINSYFDITDDKLTCQSKYYLSEQEISKEELDQSQYTYKKLNNYDDYLNALGFENGKIEEMSKIVNFLSADLTELKKISSIYLSENINKMQVKRLNKVTSRLGYNTGMLDVCFKDLEFSDEELYKIIQGMKRKIRFIKLNDNTILDTNTIESKKFFDTVTEFNLDPHHLNENQKVPLYQSLKLLSNNEEFVDYTSDEILKNILFDISHYKEFDVKIPQQLLPYMRSYQVDALRWLSVLAKYNFSGVLADDMGLGKSLEIISLIINDSTSKPSLIVCPKSLAYNWKNEFLKWNTNIEVINITGFSNDRKRIINNIDCDKKIIYISSYDSLKNDLENYNDKKFRFMILDEAQVIKNHLTLKAQSVKKIQSELRFVLTGTPIENTVVDLWSIFDFLMPNYLYNYANFKKQYEKEITINHNKDVINSLVKKITPFILRRTKQDTLNDLPEKIELIRFAEMDVEQRKVYEAQLLSTKDAIINKSSKIEILSCLTRLRQICVSPSLFMDNYSGESAKIELLISLLNELIENNHKILVFSQFTKSFDLIYKRLEENNIAYFTLTGKTEAKDRVEMANKFNSDDSQEKVFLISLKAGGTGLNLVGADVVIHLDPWWNVAAENQASDRAHRIGQKRVVNVIKIVCENTIEQKVLELQELKKQIINDVIANNDDNIVKLSDDDLKYLLS